ncbi:hypothetical protein [Desulfonatronum parangueonense]
MMTNPRFEDYLQLASEETGVVAEAVRFSRIHAKKLLLLDTHGYVVPRDMIKNMLH